MKQQHAPDLLFLRLRHAVAEAQLVLFDLLLRDSDRLGDWWRNADWRAELLVELRHLRQAQATLVFLAAQVQRTPAPKRARAHRPPNAPSGFARALYTHRRRTVWRSVPAGRGLRGRIEALRTANEQFDTRVTRMVARLREGARVAAYVMTSAPVERCVALARVDAACIDSS